MDRDALSVDGRKVRVLKERDEICLGSLLKSHDGRGLESEVCLKGSKSAPSSSARRNDAHLEVLCNFTDEPLEGQLADKKLGRLLVTTDLAESDGTRAETMRLLHTTSRSLEEWH